MSDMITLQAPAKINLTLKVVGRLSSGYHELDTWMYKICLFDEISIKKNHRGKISLHCPDSDLPENEHNLVFKAALRFYELIDEKPSVDIVLKKNIPIAAGLGGGSSDCAIVLRGLNQLFGFPLSKETLLAEGKNLGADVPFFVEDFTSARAQGIGEYLSPYDILPSCFILLVNPGIAVSTGWVFGQLAGEIPQLENYTTDSQKTSKIDNYALTRDPKTYNLGRASAEGNEAKFFNDLEEVTLKHYPDIALIKEYMKKHDVQVTLMSGSGSTVFGLFLNYEQALTCKKSIQSEYPAWKLFLTEPLTI